MTALDTTQDQHVLTELVAQFVNDEFARHGTDIYEVLFATSIQ
jgi:hypothetical protein